jgi:hypothetical protein
MAAKYSAKFRAVLGGAAPAARPTAAAPKPLHQPTIPPAAGAMSTDADCWGAICDAMKGKPQEVIEEAWFRLIEKVGGGKAVEAMTYAEWGKAKALINSVPKSAAAAPKPDPAPKPEPAPAAADPGDSADIPF